MKSFDRTAAAIVFVTILLCALCNLLLLNADSGGRQYRVEANRAADEIEKNGIESVDLSEYDSLTAIITFSDTDEGSFFETESDYVIKEINGSLYRIEYTDLRNMVCGGDLLILNAFFGAVLLIILSILLFIRQKILRPFYRLKEAPFELAKGNLTAPLKENKNRFFGRFVWGVDLLREKLEQSKRNELELQKEKKTLLLSLSHDIKTPLSAIKLYSKALSKGLYPDKTKQIEIAESINKKADEIESFVSEIVKASNEDFLYLEVAAGEFYLSEVISMIVNCCEEKLTLAGVGLTVGSYPNCMLKGDLNRLIEAVQNVIENAVKYGDGHSVSVGFSEEEDCILITVKNGGCTLSYAELPHIFDSFWRGSNVGGQAGSGLGLYICRQLMHKMGGDIFAEIKGEVMAVTLVLHKS